MSGASKELKEAGVMDKYDRYKQSMEDAGYVQAPRGYVTPLDAERIKSMLVKKTSVNHKIKVAHNQ